MWYRFKNLIQGLLTYPILSPDLRLRRQVYQGLRKRPALSLSDWYMTYGKPQNLSYSIVEFAYHHLGKYAGLDFARLLPGDRLDEDLCWTKICWFDWHLALCDDFRQRFGIDLSYDVQNLPNSDLQSLLIFLDDHLLQASSS